MTKIGLGNVDKILYQQNVTGNVRKLLTFTFFAKREWIEINVI